MPVVVQDSFSLMGTFASEVRDSWIEDMVLPAAGEKDGAGQILKYLVAQLPVVQKDHHEKGHITRAS